MNIDEKKQELKDLIHGLPDVFYSYDTKLRLYGLVRNERWETILKEIRSGLEFFWPVGEGEAVVNTLAQMRRVIETTYGEKKMDKETDEEMDEKVYCFGKVRFPNDNNALCVSEEGLYCPLFKDCWEE